MSALRYLSDWRHGIEGDWPIFVPGFLFLSIALVNWAVQRKRSHSIAELGAIVAGASLLAWLTAPLGTWFLIQKLSATPGMVLSATEGVNPGEAAVGLFTVCCWTLLLLCLVQSIQLRSFWPLLVPVVPYALLGWIRQGEAGALVATWFHRLLDGQVKAWTSLVVVLLTAGLLLRWMRESSAISRPRKPKRQEPGQR